MTFTHAVPPLTFFFALATIIRYYLDKFLENFE